MLNFKKTNHLSLTKWKAPNIIKITKIEAFLSFYLCHSCKNHLFFHSQLNKPKIQFLQSHHFYIIHKQRTMKISWINLPLFAQHRPRLSHHDIARIGHRISQRILASLPHHTYQQLFINCRFIWTSAVCRMCVQQKSAWWAIPIKNANTQILVMWTHIESIDQPFIRKERVTLLWGISR